MAIAFYVVVYTMVLKRRTAQNIVWGGAAGCMPVLIGWAAVTDSLAWAPVVLFAVVFFWTPPHFWALAIRYREDYARAGVPMLPVVASPVQVARQIVGYSWLTVAASLLLWPLATGWVYGVLAAAAGAVLLVEAHRLLRRHASAASRASRCGCSTCPTATWRSSSSPSRSTPSCADRSAAAGSAGRDVEADGDRGQHGDGALGRLSPIRSRSGCRWSASPAPRPRRRPGGRVAGARCGPASVPGIGQRDRDQPRFGAIGLWSPSSSTVARDVQPGPVGVAAGGAVGGPVGQRHRLQR